VFSRGRGRDFVLARHTHGGPPDMSVGDGGKLITFFTDPSYDSYKSLLEVALQPGANRGHRRRDGPTPPRCPLVPSRADGHRVMQ